MPTRVRVRLPRRGRTPWRSWVRSVLGLGLWVAVIGVIGVSLFILDARRSLPDPDSIVSRQVKESTKIYDYTGEVVLYDIYDEERRTVVPLDRISENLREATVAVEDARFYEHRGFDWKGFIRSIVTNLKQGYGAGGGSTITQQLVGNALVGRQKTLKRKVQELILALEVERRFSKNAILEMYLNQIPYGSNAYGAEAAAQTFFDVPAADLSIARAALLAALPQRPSYLSPYGSHVDELLARKDFILTRMNELGLITQSEYENARIEEVVFAQGSVDITPQHFVEMVREYLTEKYGEDLVQSSGYKIITTLDADLQQKAEELVTHYAEINTEKYKATNAALVATDPRTGEVRALVGSADYFNVENEGNFNVATARRQPGSAFKPFAYAAAFAKGYPDSTILWDVKTEFNQYCPADATATKDRFGLDCYHPQNYNGGYSGPVTMRQSLSRSLNIPSVKTLYLAGVDNVVSLATRMGISTLGNNTWGLSLVLGGAEVRLVDMVSAYGVFAADGIRTPWGLIKRVEGPDGGILEERKVNPERVLEAQTVRLVTDILSDNNARTPVFGVNSSLYIPGRSVAAKTGTTQENRDAWVVGYTPSLVVGVWAGNNHNQSMTAAGAGISAAGPLWNAFMRAALSNTPVESFPKPDPVVVGKPMLNGMWASPEYPQQHTVLFYVDRSNPLGPIPTSPEADPQFQNWEWAVGNR
ncbi:MAG TPA: transglycosylase domain-containing protein [Candidatus Paceibacterota bacterium]|nr:transglycosylase domain-containing protein [Candidatus Paceibacterota bacterium]